MYVQQGDVTMLGGGPPHSQGEGVGPARSVFISRGGGAMTNRSVNTFGLNSGARRLLCSAEALASRTDKTSRQTMFVTTIAAAKCFPKKKIADKVTTGI